MEAISLLIKPASGRCNMRCKYCFYEDEMCKREVKDYGIMTEDVLEKVMTRVIPSVTGTCTLMFQGGEPTVAGLAYFEKAVASAKRHNVNCCELHFTIQTNAICIDETWAAFFAEHRFLVGVSLDGIQAVHDACRLDYAGNGTFDRVMSAISLLKEYGVEFNILTVVNAYTVPEVNKIYNFYKRNQFFYQQYIECLEPLGEEPGRKEYSLTPELYGEFLKKLFDKWYRDMEKGEFISIRYFENLIMAIAGQCPESCSMLGSCGPQWVVEADGSVYPCDFYVLDQWKLGNLCTDRLETIEQKRKAGRFIELSHTVPKQCSVCKWFGLCRNGCRRNCEPVRVGVRQQNYFCEAYKEFFSYAYPRLEKVTAAILQHKTGF